MKTRNKHSCMSHVAHLVAPRQLPETENKLQCLPQSPVGTNGQCQNLNQSMNMKGFGWSFHTVKQLVTHDVRINFCPSQAPKYKIQGLWWIWQGGLADSCVGLQKNDLLSVCVHVLGRGGGGSDPLPLRQKTETQSESRELGGSTCEFNKPSMRSAASRGLWGCQWACFHPSGL